MFFNVTKVPLRIRNKTKQKYTRIRDISFVWFGEMNKTRDTCPMSPRLSENIRRALWEYSLGVGTWLSHSELQNPISHTKPPQHVSFMSKQNSLKCSTGMFYYSQCSFYLSFDRIGLQLVLLTLWSSYSADGCFQKTLLSIRLMRMK